MSELALRLNTYVMDLPPFKIFFTLTAGIDNLTSNVDPHAVRVMLVQQMRRRPTLSMHCLRLLASCPRVGALYRLSWIDVKTEAYSLVRENSTKN